MTDLNTFCADAARYFSIVGKVNCELFWTLLLLSKFSGQQIVILAGLTVNIDDVAQFGNQCTRRMSVGQECLIS